MSGRERVRSAGWRVAGRVEQEIRAYPRVYLAFYRVLNASPAIRRGVGIVKAGVRGDGTTVPVAAASGPPDLAVQRRRAATAERLGLTVLDAP